MIFFFPDWTFIVSTNNAPFKVQRITTVTRGLFHLYRHFQEDGKHTAYKLVLLR